MFAQFLINKPRTHPNEWNVWKMLGFFLHLSFIFSFLSMNNQQWFVAMWWENNMHQTHINSLNNIHHQFHFLVSGWLVVFYAMLATKLYQGNSCWWPVSSNTGTFLTILQNNRNPCIINAYKCSRVFWAFIRKQWKPLPATCWILFHEPWNVKHKVELQTTTKHVWKNVKT